MQATQQKADDSKLDISKSGFQQLPDESLFHQNLHEVIASQNDLHLANLDQITSLKKLRILRFDANKFKSFPTELLQLTSLKILDFSDNDVDQLPEEIAQLKW